jgi:hypothetical protein
MLRNKDGSISCTELQESAAEMLCERKNIAASIKDTDSVVNSLETGLGMLIHFIFIALYLLVWGVNIVQVRVLLKTAQWVEQVRCAVVHMLAERARPPPPIPPKRKAGVLLAGLHHILCNSPGTVVRVLGLCQGRL